MFKLSEKKLQLIVSIIIFCYLIFIPAIYSPDTNSYINATTYRMPLYSTFARVLNFITGDFYNVIIVIFQLLISLIGINFFFSEISKHFHFNTIFKIATFLLLCIPLFPPLYVANNVCSEALSYPLFLFTFTFGIRFYFNETSKNLLLLSISCVLLALTRTQFLLLPVIFAFSYLFYKRKLLKKTPIKKFLVLMLLPLVITFCDKTYHLLKDGFFVSTPFSYINLNTAGLFVSTQEDIKDFKNEDHKEIFKISRQFLTDNNLLESQQETKSWEDKYQFYQKHLGKICYTSFHNKSEIYYREKGIGLAKSTILTEQAAKESFFISLKNNWQKWLKLYYNNVVHGFKGLPFLIIVGLLWVFSFIKLIKKSNLKWLLSFMLFSFSISNILIVCLGSYSIIRLTFYSFITLFLGLLIITNRIVIKPNSKLV